MALPTFQAAGTFTAGTGDLTPAWPTHQADDIGFLVCETGAEAVAAPTGWTEVTNSPQAAAATRCTVFWKRATSSSETNPTITDPGDHVIAGIVTVRGARALGTPINITSGGTEGSDDSYVIPGATTTVADCLVLIFATHDFDIDSTAGWSGWANSSLANLTERVDWSESDGNGGGIAVVSGEKATAGAYGNTTSTLGVASTKGYITVAVEPPNPVSLSPGVGAATFTGIAPTVQTPRNVTPDVGAATFTGLAPTVQTPRVMLPDVGAATFTGFAPTIEATSAPPVVRTAAGGGASKRKRKVWKLHELQDAHSLAELHRVLAARQRGESPVVQAVADAIAVLDEPGPDEIALMATIADLFDD